MKRKNEYEEANKIIGVFKLEDFVKKIEQYGYEFESILMNIQVEYNRFKRFKSIKAEQEAIEMLEDPYVICTNGVSSGIVVFDKKDYDIIGVGVLKGKQEMFYNRYDLLAFDGVYQKTPLKEIKEDIVNKIKEIIDKFHNKSLPLIDEWQAIEQFANSMMQFRCYLRSTFTLSSCFFESEEFFTEYLYYIDHKILTWQNDGGAEYEVWRYRCLLSGEKSCNARYVWDSFLMYKIIN